MVFNHIYIYILVLILLQFCVKNNECYTIILNLFEIN